ncbi:hypothetical protein OG883_28545 [Streptomyces sp. NBC_01142]|uniref:hypothetical protein n=1 Tax=Streptomyces sp. NBC_01142 TaxID=2975865 RepID=UPI002258B8F5|nr:hypothetical protein [Streptomyces sp. NBC_01142]MCX4823754.1 hypothetical protein [Streptomyces sp. NBC_01142]
MRATLSSPPATRAAEATSSWRRAQALLVPHGGREPVGRVLLEAMLLAGREPLGHDRRDGELDEAMRACPGQRAHGTPEKRSRALDACLRHACMRRTSSGGFLSGFARSSVEACARTW